MMEAVLESWTELGKSSEMHGSFLGKAKGSWWGIKAKGLCSCSVLVDLVGEKQKGLLKTVVGRGSAEFGGQSQISDLIMHISFF